MTQHKRQSRRTRGARACLVAMALTWAVVPGLHALVHHREAGESHGDAGEPAGLFSHRPPGTVVVGRGRRGAELDRQGLPGDQRGDDQGSGHGSGHGDDHGRPTRGHHHHGDPRAPGSPLEHGSGAPEHLGLALLEVDPPAIPAPGQPVDSLAPAAPGDGVRAAARRRAHGSRAPPRDLAFHPSA